MKEQISLAILMVSLIINNTHAQVGIINNNPNKDATLDLNNTDGTAKKGLLLAKVALVATTSSSPMSAHTEGIHIYNTATNGTGNTQVTPGEYYNDGTKWIRISSSAWIMTGNTSTSPTTNALGTTGASDLSFRTDNTERVRITTDGKVLIGSTTLPTGATNTKLSINNGTNTGAIQIKDGSEANGSILVSDNQGITKWIPRVKYYANKTAWQVMTKGSSGTLPGNTTGTILTTDNSIVVDVAGSYVVSLNYSFTSDSWNSASGLDSWQGYVSCYIQLLKNNVIVDEIQYYDMYTAQLGGNTGISIDDIPMVASNCVAGDVLTLRLLPVPITAIQSGATGNFSTRSAYIKLIKL